MDAIAAAMLQINAATFPHLEALTPQQARRVKLANSIINSAIAISQYGQVPRKRVFAEKDRKPNRFR